MNEVNSLNLTSEDILTLSDLKKDVKKNISILKNPFPIEIFPQAIQDFILDAEATLNFDRNFFSASILSATSLSIGNTFRIKIKNGWTEKCNLYLAIIGRPGDGKSHVMKEAYSPIKDRQNTYMEQYKNEMAEHLKNPETTMKPIEKRLFLKDFTLEALTKTHSYNPKGIGIFADELMGWFNNMSRYNSGSDTEAYLEFWNGHDIISDRVKGSTLVKDSFVTVFGGIQPQKLKSIINASLEGNGFVYRILWVKPSFESYLPENDQELNLEHKRNYKTILDHILNYRENIDIWEISLSKEAKLKRREWWNNFGEKYHNEEEYIRGTSIKIRSYFNRFLVIFSVLDCANIELIDDVIKNKEKIVASIQTVEKAIILSEYFMKNAMDIRTILVNPFQRNSKRVRDWYKSLPDQFKTQDAHQSGKENNLSESSIEKYLKREDVFEKVKHGFYKKKIK
jgi:hypothetical protein